MYRERDDSDHRCGPRSLPLPIRIIIHIIVPIIAMHPKAGIKIHALPPTATTRIAMAMNAPQIHMWETFMAAPSVELLDCAQPTPGGYNHHPESAANRDRSSSLSSSPARR
jgi:hypothetical protein